MNKAERVHWSECLRQERIRRNWRQQDLADQLGTTVLIVKRWERGHQLPSSYFRQKLCALFEKSAEEFGLVSDDVSSSQKAESEISISEKVPIASSSQESDLLSWSTELEQDEQTNRLTAYLPIPLTSLIWERARGEEDMRLSAAATDTFAHAHWSRRSRQNTPGFACRQSHTG